MSTDHENHMSAAIVLEYINNSNIHFKFLLLFFLIKTTNDDDYLNAYVICYQMRSII